jgi:hypothetical protein
MKIKAAVLALLLALPAYAGDPWSKTDIVLEAGFQTMLFLDWKQTSNFYNMTYTDANRVEHSIGERNMFLPEHPKQSQINIMCLFSALGHLGISHIMDSKSRRVWQVATLTIEAYAVGNNYKVGARIQW